MALIERRDETCWRPASELIEPLSLEGEGYYGEVELCWWKIARGATSLFFGDDAVIPFHPGLPEDVSAASRQRAELSIDYQSIHFEDYTGWLPLPDLALDFWTEERLILTRKVPAQFALLFSSGDLPLPVTQLIENGMPLSDVRKLEDWNPISRAGRVTIPEYRLHQLPADYLIQVSWSVTFAEYVGTRIWKYGFQKLVDQRDSELYRVVMAYA